MLSIDPIDSSIEPENLRVKCDGEFSADSLVHTKPDLCINGDRDLGIKSA